MIRSLAIDFAPGRMFASVLFMVTLTINQLAAYPTDGAKSAILLEQQGFGKGSQAVQEMSIVSNAMNESPIQEQGHEIRYDRGKGKVNASKGEYMVLDSSTKWSKEDKYDASYFWLSGEDATASSSENVSQESSSSSSMPVYSVNSIQSARPQGRRGTSYLRKCALRNYADICEITDQMLAREHLDLYATDQMIHNLVHGLDEDRRRIALEIQDKAIHASDVRIVEWEESLKDSLSMCAQVYLIMYIFLLRI